MPDCQAVTCQSSTWTSASLHEKVPRTQCAGEKVLLTTFESDHKINGSTRGAGTRLQDPMYIQESCSDSRREDDVQHDYELQDKENNTNSNYCSTWDTAPCNGIALFKSEIHGLNLFLSNSLKISYAFPVVASKLKFMD